jgi:hypothetical protein
MEDMSVRGVVYKPSNSTPERALYTITTCARQLGNRPARPQGNSYGPGQAGPIHSQIMKIYHHTKVVSSPTQSAQYTVLVEHEAVAVTCSHVHQISTCAQSLVVMGDAGEAYMRASRCKLYSILIRQVMAVLVLCPPAEHNMVADFHRDVTSESISLPLCPRVPTRADSRRRQQGHGVSGRVVRARRAWTQCLSKCIISNTYGPENTNTPRLL